MSSEIFLLNIFLLLVVMFPTKFTMFFLPGMDNELETTNTFEFHSIEKMGDFGGCYLTCKNPQATLTIQRYVNGKRKKTIYGKGSITFNAKEGLY